jgi:hypothetical protein
MISLLRSQRLQLAMITVSIEMERERRRWAIQMYLNNLEMYLNNQHEASGMSLGINDALRDSKVTAS